MTKKIRSIQTKLEICSKLSSISHVAILIDYPRVMQFGSSQEVCLLRMLRFWCDMCKREA